jgi:hypothetical protein
MGSLLYSCDLRELPHKNLWARRSEEKERLNEVIMRKQMPTEHEI